MDDNIRRTPPLSPQELCKRAEDLWAEVRRTRFSDEGDEFPHMVPIMKLMYAVWTLLNRTNMTPDTMLWAYWNIRGVLDQLGFTPEREQEVQQEEEERVADARFLMDHGIRTE